MELLITLAEPDSVQVQGDLGSLQESLQVDPRLAGRTVLTQHAGAAPAQHADAVPTLGLVQELIAPITDLGADALRALPVAVAVWIKQRRCDLKVSYEEPDGTKVVVEIQRLRDPERTLREVIAAMLAITRR